MSDEEKKALERIDYIQDFIIENGQYNADVNDMEYFSRIKNLIEKQSKEIEELKKPKYVINCKTNEITKLTNDFVSKDKIKAKIEEMDIEIQCCEYADDDVEEYKQDMEKEKRRLLRDKVVLQSLLEDKEEGE